jgi:hypothetical protein
MLEKITELPKQAIPYSQKTDEWHKKCADAFIEMSRLNGEIRKEDLRALYEYYNGTIRPEDYNYVLNPYGQKSIRTGFPSMIRNYPIIKPVIDLLLGEKVKRPFHFSVISVNSDAYSLKEQKKMEALKQNLETRFAIKATKELGMQPQQEEEQVQLPEQILDMFDRTYKDNRAILGQKSLNYIVKDVRFREKDRLNWFHFLTAGECYSLKDVVQGEVKYEVINPIDIDYDKDPDNEFVEDGDWALVRKLVHASTIIDYYNDQLTKEQVIRLENPRQITGTPFSIYNTRPTNSQTIQNSERNRLIEWVRIYWKSRCKKGFVTYLDPETGEWEEKVVDETYRPVEGEIVEWVWINEIRKAAVIDGDIYVDMGKVYNTRTSLENPSLGKLPINGRKYSNINAENISLVKLGIPYQINYNIYKYRLELAIAKSKDVIAQFDINMIPKKWTMDKFMYHLDGTGIAWVDYNKEGVKLSPQHQSILDLTIKTIESYIQLLESIVIEWERVSGVTRQRQGNIGTYDSVTGSQQAIIQSSHITEDLFAKYEEFINRDLQGLLDISKEAWLDGKEVSYILPDGAIDFMRLDPVEHANAEYGTFVTSSGKEVEKVEGAKALAQHMLNSGTPASAVLQMWDSESFAEIKEHIRKAEVVAAKLAQEQSKYEAESQARNIQMQQEFAMAMKDKEIQADILLGQLEHSADTANPQEATRIAMELEEMRAKLELETKKFELEQKKVKNDYEIAKEKNQIDRSKPKTTTKK